MRATDKKENYRDPQKGWLVDEADPGGIHSAQRRVHPDKRGPTWKFPLGRWVQGENGSLVLQTGTKWRLADITTFPRIAESASSKPDLPAPIRRVQPTAPTPAPKKVAAAAASSQGQLIPFSKENEAWG